MIESKDDFLARGRKAIADVIAKCEGVLRGTAPTHADIFTACVAAMEHLHAGPQDVPEAPPAPVEPAPPANDTAPTDPAA